MANTLQTVVNLARIPLNDSDPTDGNRRWPDATLLIHVNHGLLAMYRKRPDFWFDDWDNVPTGSLALTTPLPIPDEWIQPLADWVTARASTNDDEVVPQGRAAQFMAIFEAGVTNG